MAKGKVLSKVAGKVTGKATKKTRKKMTKAELEALAKKKEDSPKVQKQKEAEAKLNKRMKEKDPRKEATGREKRLLDLKAALQKNRNPRKDLEYKPTPKEAGRKAERMMRGYRLQEAKGKQGAFNRLKAEVEWLKQNDPQSPLIADRRAEMRRLYKSADIDKDMEVKPRKPTGASTPEERLKERRLKQIREVAKKREEKRFVEEGGKKLSDDVTNSEKKMAKGGYATKKNKGAMDYRAGGMVLSVQDRRKNRG